MKHDYKLYTLDNEFISGSFNVPKNFTGIVKSPNGTKLWFLNENLHRIDGPALITKNGFKEWWLNGRRVTEEQHKLLVDILKLKGLL